MVSSRSRQTRVPAAGAGDRGAANWAIGVIAEPQVDAISVKRVLTSAQLPELVAVGKCRQADRAFASDFLRVGVVLVPEVGDRSGGDGATVVGVAGILVRSPAARRAPKGADEGVDHGGDGDDGDDGEEEFQGREVDGARWAGERWRWRREDGNLLGGEWRSRGDEQ